MTDTRTIIEMAGGSEEDRMFEGAVNSVLHMDKRDYPAYVNGLMVASGREFIVSSPIDESIRFGSFQDPDDGTADTAADAAHAASAEWSRTGPERRAGVFEMALDSIRRQRFRLAAAVTINSGMVRSQALGEVDVLIRVLEENIRRTRSGKGTGAAGVWAVVSEHNSPLAAPASYAAAAMLAGNAVVMMPSRHVPIPVYMFYDIMKAAMLPPGVLNVIVDRSGRATEELLGNEMVEGAVAIGSGGRTEEMMFLRTDDRMRFMNEIKGMNPVLVSRPSDMAAAVRAIVGSAFSFNGQAVSACSKVVVMEEDRERFMEALMKEIGSITVGDPVDRGRDIGPLISGTEMDRFLSIAEGLKDSTVSGGRRVTGPETDAGYFVRPLVVAGLPADSEFNNIDHGLPILSVQFAPDRDEAMEMVNGCEFGLSSGVYTRDRNAAGRFVSEAAAENVYVNDPHSVRSVAVKADTDGFR